MTKPSRKRERKSGALSRVQTGVRLERRMLKVLKGLAEYLDLSLAEVLELIVLQSFERSAGFSAGTLRRINELKQIYEMDYDLAQAQRVLFAARTD